MAPRERVVRAGPKTWGNRAPENGAIRLYDVGWKTEEHKNHERQRRDTRNNRLDVILKPGRQLLSGHLTVSEGEHQTLLLIDGRDEFQAVQEQEHFHRRVGDTLVAVDEGVV